MPYTVHIDGNSGWGGGQEQSLGLALALGARGEKVTFIAQADSALASRLDGAFLDWHALPLRGLPGLAATPRLAKHLRRMGPDLVHIHDSASHGIAGPAARLAGVPRIVVTRRTDFPLRRGWAGRAKYELWCDRVVCVSESVRRRCLDGGLRADMLSVIPDFVDCRRFRPDAVAPADDQPETIVAVGRLSREKGHGVLLRAMRGVLDQCPGARLVICGEGEEENKLRAQARALGIARAVEFAGFWADVRPLLAAASVFAMPSLSEGFGVAVLEAMAMGKPVVAANVGGLPESVVQDETGLLVPPGDADALAEALIALLRDPARARAMGRAGLARARAQFDRPRAIERMLALYEEMLQGAAS